VGSEGSVRGLVFYSKQMCPLPSYLSTGLTIVLVIVILIVLSGYPHWVQRSPYRHARDQHYDIICLMCLLCLAVAASAVQEDPGAISLFSRMQSLVYTVIFRIYMVFLSYHSTQWESLGSTLC
jgi:quinol-cytochrome oxidoreductase complex cytochrome b subunit